MNTKIIKWGLILLVGGLIIVGGIVFYLFNMPKRDVQATAIDYEITTQQIVLEYLTNTQSANDKYLQEEGESKILATSGIVASIDEDLNHQKVVLLKGGDDKAGVSCTFTTNTNVHAADLKIGDKVTIKGVIRSGAGYDEDLDLYEDVIMEKCDVINN